METTTRSRTINGQPVPLPDQAAEANGPRAEAVPRDVIGRFLKPSNGTALLAGPVAAESSPQAPLPVPLAVFCHEAPDSYVGGHVRHILTALAGRGVPVHLFSRHAFDLGAEGASTYVVGTSEEGDTIDQVQEFTRR